MYLSNKRVTFCLSKYSLEGLDLFVTVSSPLRPTNSGTKVQVDNENTRGLSPDRDTDLRMCIVEYSEESLGVYTHTNQGHVSPSLPSGGS